MWLRKCGYSLIQGCILFRSSHSVWVDSNGTMWSSAYAVCSNCSVSVIHNAVSGNLEWNRVHGNGESHESYWHIDTCETPLATPLLQ